MSPAPVADLRDIPADVQKRLGLKKARRKQMSIDTVRTHAIRVLAVVADLTPSQRARVLNHAHKMNAL